MPLKGHKKEASMDFKVAGISLYYIINWFFIYSFLGWVWESCYVSVKSKKPVNRGFINGPFCTIYGFGAVSVYLILKDFDQNLLVLYIGGVVVATVLEYITGWLMETIFHTSWWDYSKKKCNLHGYICLGSSLAWGVFTVLLFEVFHSCVEWLTNLYPVSIGKIAVSVVAVLYSADFVTSAVAAFGISKKLAKLEDMMEELTAYLQTTKLYETKEEISDRLEEIRAFNLAEAAEKIGTKKAEFSKLLEERFSLSENYLEKKAELERRMDEFSEKYLSARKKSNIVGKRMIHAYPGLRAEFRRYKERKAKKH